MLKINESVDGATVAPASPSSARLTISISALVDSAASTDVTPNAAAPTNSSRDGRSGHPTSPS